MPEGHEIIEYKLFDIEYNFYGFQEYTVQYCGDEIWCKTLEEAKALIDEALEMQIM